MNHSAILGAWQRLCLLAMVFWASPLPLGAVPPPANRGVFVIWYGDKYDLLNVPYLTGGQVVAQWGEVDKGAGRYDFAQIGDEVRKLKQRGKKTTVQINGNSKPAWLFSQVPFYPEKLSEQVRDKPGTLMYWHPTHLTAYTNMLRAFAGYLAASSDRDAVLGLRLNFDAMGTEHFTVPLEARDPAKWKVPPGVSPGPPWSPEVVLPYEKAVVDTFVNLLSPHAKIFVRNNIKPEIETLYRPQCASGKLGWFHTSSEAEPRSSGTEIQYRRFFEDCRSGRTVGYAEPWASAWGDHGGGPDHRWCSPPQWNYWRSLLDLHCGVACIALYANDLNVAVKGTYQNRRTQYDEQRDQLGFQQEFESAFRFTAKYVGYHASPEESPGAWVAFRENATVLANNPKTMPKGRQLSVFTNDYNFLMERLPDRTSGAHDVGPSNQRQGAWARILPAKETMQFKLDDRFAASWKGGRMRVTYLDQTQGAGSSFNVAAGSAQATVPLKNSGRWQTVDLELPATPWARNARGAHGSITAGAKPLYLHMVEFERQ